MAITKQKYEDFIRQKAISIPPCGLDKTPHLNKMLFPFQADIVRWALRRGRAAIFADCGLGKTPMQLEWARHVPGKVLILAPLAVSQQTVREGKKFGIDVFYARKQQDCKGKITITNYEMLNRFDPDLFDGIVLDESSILKSYTGKIRTEIIDSFDKTAFRLACTATPAPNDYMELGNHSQFLGTMSRTEMLSMFFVHDGSETQKWRLKGHAQNDFWEWLCSWAVMIRKPSDLGYDDGQFILPPLNIHHIITKHNGHSGDFLFHVERLDLQERIQARRESVFERAEACFPLVKNADEQEPWLFWCNLNAESEAIKKIIPLCEEIRGSDSIDKKENVMLGFSSGRIQRLVTKPSIAGFGMNWEHCNNVVFVGLSDSYEQFYQAVRRCWRFGQKKPVNCYVITSETEGDVVKNIERKEKDAEKMAQNMVKMMGDLNRKNLRGTMQKRTKYKTEIESGKGWIAHLGDCCEVIKSIGADSIDYSIFSPPFASLYTYSDSERDMGNCRTHDEFYYHMKFLVNELLRIIKPGRLVSFHCMNLPTSKVRDGFIGLVDFRGELIRLFVNTGFIYASEVCIWKNPVTAMQRTKAKGLLHKQIVKDSTECRQGIPDYLVTMRKPGVNKHPVAGELDHFAGDQSTFQRTGRLSIDIWQRYASPVWMDINQSNTLQKDSAREEKDERHICPLQLDVIHRALQLWTNEQDLVLSPFAGIGSEGYEAIKMSRRFIGIELKESYWKQCVSNFKAAEKLQETLF